MGPWDWGATLKRLYTPGLGDLGAAPGGALLAADGPLHEGVVGEGLQQHQERRLVGRHAAGVTTVKREWRGGVGERGETGESPCRVDRWMGDGKWKPAGTKSTPNRPVWSTTWKVVGFNSSIPKEGKPLQERISLE